jgi:hypothetical protein
MTLGWYPREEPSLEALLKNATQEDLETVALALGDRVPPTSRSEAYIAKRIYQMRNALVHYRPFHRKVSTRGIDWNRLCEAMARLVFDVYGKVCGRD